MKGDVANYTTAGIYSSEPSYEEKKSVELWIWNQCFSQVLPKTIYH
jgi:hypothetical protein